VPSCSESAQPQGESKEEPLSNELIEFLNTSKIKVTDKLTAAFNEIGIEETDDFDDLDEGMTATLEDAMKPIEKKRFRKSLNGRKQGDVKELDEEAKRTAEKDEENRLAMEALALKQKEAAREKAASLEREKSRRKSEEEAELLQQQQRRHWEQQERHQHQQHQQHGMMSRGQMGQQQQDPYSYTDENGTVFHAAGVSHPSQMGGIGRYGQGGYDFNGDRR
jgi:Skp family chaperone for outer membrane proteins